jgi:hypothetical protein
VEQPVIQTADFTKWLCVLLAETFGVADTADGYVLDSGQSGLLGTINTLSAAVASAAGRPEQATIASHCGHVLFILRLFDAYERGQQPAPDWQGSWTTRVVDDAAWQTLRSELQIAYEAVVSDVRKRDMWPEAAVAAALMLVTHCAYHVGEIRQRLTWVTP